MIWHDSLRVSPSHLNTLVPTLRLALLQTEGKAARLGVFVSTRSLRFFCFVVHSHRLSAGGQFSPRREFPVAENAQPYSVPSQSHCVIWNSEKLQRPGDGSRASLPGSASSPQTLPRGPATERPFREIRAVTPRLSAPPSIATASPHLITSPPRLLLRRARSWPREPR